MSEPYSAVMQVTIAKPRLLAYFAQAPVPASRWSDWPEIGGDWHSFDFATGLAKLLTEVDSKLGGDYLACHRRLLNPDMPALSRLQYDQVEGTFTFANMMLSENLAGIIEFLAVMRGIAPFMAGGDRGFALVHDYLWGHRPVTVIGLEPGASRFLNNAQSIAHYEQSLRQGIAVLDRIVQEGDSHDSAASTDRIQSFVH